MKLLQKLFIIATLLGVLSFSACAEKKSETKEVTSAVVPVKALPKLIDLGAHKCIPCKQMAPILEELKTEYKETFSVEFIDVWQQENVEAAKTYNISSIPTQIFFDENAKELFRHVGYFSKEEILSTWTKLGYSFVDTKETCAVKNETVQSKEAGCCKQ